MRIADFVRIRLRSLLSRAAVEQELDEELQYHLEREIDANMAAGLSPAEARSAALRSISGLTQRKEECRDMRGFNFIDTVLRDFRYSLRQLRKNPGFTFTAIFVLALGMCASVAIFAFVDAALIKPLPYRDPSRLLGVFEKLPFCKYCNLSYPDYVDWEKRNVVFTSFTAYQGDGYALGTPTGPQPVRGARVTDSFLRTLGVAPAMGRDFTADDDLPSTPHTAMLSYAAWQHRYGGKRDVVGQVVMLDGEPVTIVGVLPREFHFAPVGQPEFWVAYQPTNGCDKRRSCHGMYGVARLKDGVSMQTALSNVIAIAAQLEKEYPDSNRGQGANVAPLAEGIVGQIRPILLVLLSGAALLLLIASVNVAGLQLVRSESRGREIAVRTALGASSGRLIGQFLTEALVLAAAGAALGLFSAHWAIVLLKGLISENMMAGLPFLSDLGLNGHVLAIASVITLAAVALLSMPPSGRIWSSQVRAGLAEGSRGSAGTTWRKLGSKLVVVELATAMVLLAGAGLLGKSLYLLLRVSIGVQTDHLVTMDVAIPGPTYKTDQQTIAVSREIIRGVEGLPGVQSVGFAGLGIPMSGNGNTTWFRVLGRPWHGEHNESPERDVSITYFPTLGAKLISGRYFNDAEDSSKPRVAIINQAFAKHYFPNEDPLGKQLADLHPKPTTIEIVGVVEDIREGPLDAAIPPVLYIPYNQSVDNYFSLVVRTSQDERSLIPALRAAIHQIDRDIVPIGGETLIDRINDSQSAYLHRSLAWLVGGFAGLALLLGVVGLYGVIAYSVSQRSREIGIRMALGAQTGSVYGLILREAGWLTIVGITLGIVGSVAAATLMRDLLFGVRSWDMATLGSVAAILGVAALVASFIPARRAASVNPVDALRAE
jgi:macrolide transport system ATP-binding/permease protein